MSIHFQVTSLRGENSSQRMNLYVTLLAENQGVVEAYISPNHFALVTHPGRRFLSIPLTTRGALLFPGERLTLNLMFRLPQPPSPLTLYWLDRPVGRVVPAGHGLLWQPHTEPIERTP